jgi:hypothetical protein
MRTPTTSSGNVRILRLATLNSNVLLLPLPTLSSMVPVVPAEELQIRGEPLCRYQLRLDLVIRIMDGQELVLITVSSKPTIRIRGQLVRRPMRRLDPPTTSNNAVEVVEVVVVEMVVVEDVGVGVAVVLGDGTEITYQDNGYYDTRGSRRGN